MSEVACPSCGKVHLYKGNCYCLICKARFRRRGMFDTLDKEGNFSIERNIDGAKLIYYRTKV